MSALWGYFDHLHKGGGYTYIYRCQQFNVDPVHTCPYIFENRDFVLRFQKITRPHVAYLNRFSQVHMKTLKR